MNALLLRRSDTGWQVVRGADGVRLETFSQVERARMWLQERGYQHTDNMAGESRAEVWTK